MKLTILFIVLMFCAVLGSAADLVPTPSSLSFGNVTQGQAKTLSFILKNTSGHRMVAEMTITSPFKLSTAKITLTEGQQASVSVTLPANAAAGNPSGKVTVKGSRIGLIPRLEAEVPLSASITVPPAGPDLQITASDNGNEVNQTVRSVGVHLLCKHTTATVAMKTQVFVSLDNGPEQKMMDISFVYTPAGQINAYGQQIPTTVKTMRIRAVTDPDNSVTETNEGNNQSIITLNF